VIDLQNASILIYSLSVGQGRRYNMLQCDVLPYGMGIVIVELRARRLARLMVEYSLLVATCAICIRRSFLC
jgi:hypothetical protein